MYLKTLEIHGFKSFADKTMFEFHTGVTGIVGPNGCGKSNVVDAIRWVLGETSAKALRGGEMADVIFNGTDKRKPVNMAEVVLTLADCEQGLGVDYNEVALSRRVFRDGRSEYRINGTICRLKDIQDLLAGTGIGRAAYSVMEQGKIDMLISAKPEDRRMVFEEAAGITKFKSQKKEALRKLEYTEANLLRVQDIVAEVKRQMGSVQRQAQKARRFQGIHRDLRTLDLHLGHHHFTEYSAEKSEAENQIISLMTQLNEFHQSIHTKEAEVTETREAYRQVEGQISGLRAQAQELRSKVQSAESKIEFNTERADELEGRIRRNEEDAANNRDQLDRQRQEMAAADEQFSSIHDTIESRRYALEEHQVSHNAIIPERYRLETERRTLRETFRRIEGEVATEEARAQSLTQQMSADRERHETLQLDKQDAAAAREAAQVEYDHLHRQIEEQESVRAELEDRLREIGASITEMRKRRDSAAEELHDLERQLAQRKSRLEVLNQILEKGEGLEKGTQAVLAGLDSPDRVKAGVVGLVSSAIEVAHQYVSALEVALKDHLQAVLLNGSILAQEIITKLREGRLGKTTLAPCNLIPYCTTDVLPPLPQGGVAWALEKVKCQPEVQPLIDQLLGNVLIVEDLSTALHLKGEYPNLTFATLVGELLTSEGLLYGGASQEDSMSTLRRETEVRELRVQVESLEQRIDEKNQQIEDLLTRLEELGREEGNVRDQVQHARETLTVFQGKVAAVQRTLQQATAKLDSLEWEQNQIGGRLAEAEGRIQKHRDAAAQASEQLTQTQDRELELDVAIEAVARREAESTEMLNELKTALALEQNALQSAERQKAPLASRLTELESSITRYENECFIWKQRVEAARNESQRLSEDLEGSRVQLSQIESEGSECIERRNTAFERVTALESDLNSIRQRQSQLNDHRSRAEVQQTRIDLRLENLNAQVSERYQISLDSFEPDPHALLLAINEQRKGHLRSTKRKGGSSYRDLEDTSRDDLDDAADIPSISADNEAEAEASPESEGLATAEEDQDLEAAGAEFLDAAALEQGPDWSLVQEMVTDLRQRLDGMGSVNMEAIQEFEELEERHNFLDGQHNDLVKSKDELLQVIAKINETTKTMFSETFVAVRNNFRQNFKELFGAGAQADLMLSDENDPLECGIEIVAKPPGKKLSTISLLSGGERSMTAVALLFSIYMVKPSPFCVLDELDAPLDESNISRFLVMLDKFIERSQFIVVTHNKRTMNRADVIYGVTMQEFGVSKPVGVRMTHEKVSLEEGQPTVADTVSGKVKRRPKAAEAEAPEPVVAS